MAVTNKNVFNHLTLLNWNPDGIKAQRAIFIDFLSRYNIDVAFISETHLIVNEKFTIPGYRIYRHDRIVPTASGGAAIIIKNNIRHYQIPEHDLTNLEAIAVEILVQHNCTIRLIAAYQSPNRQLLSEDITSYFNTDLPTLLLGDLNSKNALWGCRVNNPNGKRLHEITTQHNIHVTAPKEYTHYPYRSDHKPDILDIGLQKNLTQTFNHQVLTELDSGHLPVVITMDKQPENIVSSPRLINGVVDWDKFKEHLNVNIRPQNLPYTALTVDNAVKHLTNTIVRAAQLSTQPSTKNVRHSYPKPHTRTY